MKILRDTGPFKVRDRGPLRSPIPHTWGTLLVYGIEKSLPGWLARFLRVPLLVFSFVVDLTLTLWASRYDAIAWLLAVVVAALMFLPGCRTPGDGDAAPFVGFATAAGNGDLRTDLDVYLLLGRWEGVAGIFVLGGVPVALPLESADDEWHMVRRSTKENVLGKLGVDPLPAVTRRLFRVGELDSLSVRFGKVITIADPSSP